MAWQKCNMCNERVKKPYLSLCPKHNEHNLRRSKSCGTCTKRKKSRGPGMAIIDYCDVLGITVQREAVCDLWEGPLECGP